MATPIPANRCVFDAAEIVQTTNAAFSGRANLRVEGVALDSRNLREGALFVALRGVRDGHEFIRAAAQAGAAAAIVEQGRRHPDLPCFEVNDTLSALGALARHHLQRVRSGRRLPTVAIGGAAGKTTTKELTAALMRTVFGETLATPGNLNNLIGVPMTIFMLAGEHRAAVLECGTNQRGEVARLGDIVRPDVALVLNVDIEHTEGLGSLAGVADEEAALFSTARTAIVGVAEKMLTARIPAAMPRVTFGADSGADVRLVARRVIAPGGQRIKLGLAPRMVQAGVPAELDAALHLLGAATAENAAAAVAAFASAWAAPLERCQLGALAEALGSVLPVAGRLSTHEVAGIVVIDDSYNANPRSVRAALAAARETADGLRARLVIALGDMLELGELSLSAHTTTISEVLATRPDQFVAVGHEFAGALNDLPESYKSQTVVAGDSVEAAAMVRRLVRRGDVLLVKGSRGIQMERVIESLSAV
jgi:UDP-N-acetylmuramoyl-tripeptide--D-alanyl-D-alanine ligase